MEMSTTIDVPKLGEFLLGDARTAHNRIAKGAVRGVLVHHHGTRIPGHFSRSAHGKYGYKLRQSHYRLKKQKKYGSTIDLVQTGKSKNRISEKGDVAVGGTGADGALRGTLTMRFDWEDRVAEGVKKKYDPRRLVHPPKPRKKPSVTIQDMKSEVARTTAGERKEMAIDVRNRYVEGVKYLAPKRQRIKV